MSESDANENVVKSDIVWNAYSGDLPAVIRNIENGADMEDRHEDGSTPLIAAAWGGRTDVVRYLMSCGANVDAYNARAKWTALHAASFNSNLPCVLLLLNGAVSKDKGGVDSLSQRADPSTLDAEGKTALKIAQEKGNTPIADAILAREKQIEQEKLAEIAAGSLAKKAEPTDHRVCGGSCLIA